MKDYYRILEIDSKASQDDIKKAFREKAKKYHPDVNKSPDAESKFREINEAYEFLSDESKRKSFDLRNAGFNIENDFFAGFNPSDLNDIFKMYFDQQDFHFQQQIQKEIQISIEEAWKGCSRQIKIQNKTLTLNITPRTAHGTIFSYQENNLKINLIVSIIENEKFKVVESDIYSFIEIEPHESILGSIKDFLLFDKIIEIITIIG